MWTFQYKHGDRPLDGFTIQRAAGRGGFGEVYYAVSDSGREVALKAVTGYEQIEVRGISQCMNLKSPHLVTIFDVKYNDQGKPFVIMEFVSGPNLRQLLDESPAGLGTQKAAFFLREIGKGLTFLHDCGIVHRDLKPANIFFENGYVKIGDYGLSKAISPTHHSGQTVTVGTVHYMAPEVGAGKYDRSIDIYAMGAVLYEMLTGTVPFIGASPSEILIKHLQADPDCTGIPEPFCTVIRKAMAKDPLQRYANVQEMVEAVFGATHVQMSVSHFSPNDLSMVAGRVAQNIAVGSGGPGSGASVGAAIGTAGLGGTSGSSSVIGGETVTSRNPNRFGDDANDGRGWKQVMNQPFEQLRNRMDQLSGKSAIPTQPKSEIGINDPLPIASRRMLGVLTAVVVAIAMGVLTDSYRFNERSPIELPLFVFTAICGASFGLLIGWRYIAIPKLSAESHAVRKLVVATVTCGSMLLLSGFFWLLLANHHNFSNMTLLAILGPLSLVNTWEWARANRAERVSLNPSIEVALFGLVITWVFHGDSMLTCGVLAGISLAVQVMAPWDPVLAKKRTETLRSKLRGAKEDQREAAIFGNVTTDDTAAQEMQRAGTRIFGNLRIETPNSAAAAWTKQTRPKFPVWQHARMIWFLAAVLSFSIGLTCIIVGAASQHADQQSLLVGFGICGMINALICFVRSFSKTYSTIWVYLIRPVLMMICVLLIVMFATNVSTETTPDIFSVFLIIISSIGLLTMPFLRFDKKVSTAAAVIPPPILSPIAVNTPAPSIIPPIPPIPPMPSLHPLRSGNKGWTKSVREYRHWIRQDRAHQLRNGKGFLSIAAALLIFISIALTFAIGLDLPFAVAHGLPDADTARNIRVNLIGDYPTWQILANKLLVMLDGITIIAAITFTLIARSGKNFLHLFRACFGIIGMVLAVAFAAGTFHGEEVWPLVAQSLAKSNYRPDMAIDTIISGFQNPATLAAIPLFILSTVILNIRPRDRSKNAPKGAA